MDNITRLVIYDLLSVAKAREFGYGNVLFKIDDNGLRKIFKSFIINNDLFAEQLREIIIEEASYRIYPHSVRPVYNEWAKIKSSVDLDSTLMACMEAERITYQAYKGTLNNVLPNKLEILIKNQLEELYMIIPVLNLYRDLYKIETENSLQNKASA